MEIRSKSLLIASALAAALFTPAAAEDLKQIGTVALPGTSPINQFGIMAINQATGLGYLADKDNSAVAENAKKLSESFDQIAKFWEKKHKDDAVKLAEAARDAGKALASATSAEDQTAALAKVGGTCRGCHTVYRDGSNFKN